MPSLRSTKRFCAWVFTGSSAHSDQGRSPAAGSAWTAGLLMTPNVPSASAVRETNGTGNSTRNR